MKTKKETKLTVVRNIYTAQFKEQALELADRDGVPKVTQNLGLAESILYNWRAKRLQTGQPFEEQKLQQAELARLKRGNARLEEEVAFLKKATGDSIGHCKTAEIFCEGDIELNVFLGRSFNSAAILSNCCCE